MLKAAADRKGDSAEHEVRLTPDKSGDRISKEHTKDIRLTIACTTVRPRSGPTRHARP
ncbi:hypothetical protein ACFCYX_36495 [Streptomyces populi]|uniref:hypothetical protein n=1 Tax=Streptomyces populi TaxID=2058924 RepID=UPI0013A6D0E0|nr:hypothetical protein [Streptomyces populi]